MFYEDVIYFVVGLENKVAVLLVWVCVHVCICVLLSYTYCFVKFVVEPIIFYYYLILVNLIVIGNLFLLKGGSYGQQQFKKLIFLTWAESR